MGFYNSFILRKVTLLTIVTINTLTFWPAPTFALAKAREAKTKAVEVLMVMIDVSNY
jgi:hypothetical protein